MSKKKKNEQPVANEPIASYGSSSELNADVIWQLFKETDKKFQETDKQFRETDKQFRETDKKFQETDRMFKETDKKLDRYAKEWDEIKKELGGIGKSNGEIAEEYFFSALDKSLKVGKMTFDYISRNLHRKKKLMEAEYDIVLWNDHKVIIIEVKYNFRMDQLHKFYKDKLKKFKSLFPEYKQFKVFGGIASMTISSEVAETASEYGFYVLTQYNEKVSLLNDPGFEPTEVK